MVLRIFDANNFIALSFHGGVANGDSVEQLVDEFLTVQFARSKKSNVFRAYRTADRQPIRRLFSTRLPRRSFQGLVCWLTFYQALPRLRTSMGHDSASWGRVAGLLGSGRRHFVLLQLRSRVQTAAPRALRLTAGHYADDRRGRDCVRLHATATISSSSVAGTKGSFLMISRAFWRAMFSSGAVSRNSLVILAVRRTVTLNSFSSGRVNVLSRSAFDRFDGVALDPGCSIN